MLGKLLKYDLKWTYKNLIVFYCLTIFFALIGRGLNLIENSSVFHVLSLISCGTSVAMMFNILINNIMRLWARLIQNVYKDESYLTHTLPVKKSDIYLSKVLCALITFFTSIVVIIFGLVICYCSSDLINFLKAFVIDSFWTVLIEIIIVIFLELLFVVFVGYLGIIIGYGFNNGKLVKSLACGFGIYIGCSMISLVALFILALFNSNLMEMFTSNVSSPDFGVIKDILILAVILYLIYIIICNVISNKLLKRGVNID